MSTNMSVNKSSNTKFNKVFAFAGVAWIFSVFVSMSLTAAGIYVLYHFISKLW